MILRPSVMWSFTSWRDPFRGKDCPADQRLKNMQPLKRKRRKPQLRTCARINQKNSKNSCITAEASHSRRTQTTVTSSVFLKAVWRGMDLTQKIQISFGTKIGLSSKRKQLRDRWWTSSTKSLQKRLPRISICEILRISDESFDSSNLCQRWLYL